MNPSNQEPARSDMVALIGRRSVLMGGWLLATSAAAAAVTPRRHEGTLGSARLKDVIPTKVGPWTQADGGSVVVPETAAPIGYYDQVLTRTFAAPELPPIMLLIAYGGAQSGLMKVHRPEVCYASSGFRIVDPTTHPIALAPGADIPTRRFLADRQDRQEQVLYWTRVSNAFPESLDAQRWIMIKEGVRGVIPDGVLVRLSTFQREGASGQLALQTFAKALISSSNPTARAVLIGRLKPMASDRKAAA